MLAHPEGESRADSREVLADWVEQFPAFSAARLLLAKSARDAGTSDADRKLAEAAAYTSGPYRLFDLLNRQAIVEEVDAFARAVDGLSDELEEVLMPLPEVMPTEVSVHAPAVDQDLAREVALVAIESSLGKEVEAFRQAEAKAEEEIGGVPAPAPRLVGAEVALSPLAQWALSRSGEVGFGQGHLRKTDESTAVGGTVEVEESAPLDPKRQANLVDLFIQNDPRIGPVDAGAPRPVVHELARESIVEDVSLVTETMARIYAGQGHLGRARKAYRLLALKYPEKSVYFAAQSEKLATGQSDRK
jgi:hypothetical protein